MSAPRAMTPLRRRAIPGMTQAAYPANSPAGPTDTPPPPGVDEPAAGQAPRVDSADEGRRSDDYSATRRVNFRLPVDLHDRYRRLVQEVEREHPRLRRPSLTEIIIGLLEEGPNGVDEVAAVIRRKRASEYRDGDDT